MVDLNTFVANRQQSHMNKEQRQVVGDRYRVPIPPTKLTQAVDMRQIQAASVLPLMSARLSPEPGKLDSRENYCFDTDAESIDNSTNADIQSKWNEPSYDGQIRVADESIARKPRVQSAKYLEPSGYQNGPLGEPDDDAIASRSDGDDDLSEAESAKNSGSHNVLSDLSTDVRSEEFLNFKKRNVLDRGLFQSLHPSPKQASDLNFANSSFALVSGEKTIGTSARPRTTSHESAYLLTKPKSQKLEKNLVDSTRYSLPRIDRNRQHMPPSSAAKEPLATSRTTHEHHRRSLQILPREIPVGLHHAYGSTETTFASELPFDETSSAQKPDPKIEDQNIQDSELTNDGGPEALVVSGNKQALLKRRLSLDHSWDELHKMDFQDLLKEGFDSIPATIQPLQKLAPVKISMRVTLEQLSSDNEVPEYLTQHQGFFERLSLGEYVECGEIIGEFLKKAISDLSHIRREKRVVIGKFEKEIVDREATLGHKIAALKRKKGVMTRQTEELTAMRTAQIHQK